MCKLCKIATSYYVLTITTSFCWAHSLWLSLFHPLCCFTHLVAALWTPGRSGRKGKNDTFTNKRLFVILPKLVNTFNTLPIRSSWQGDCKFTWKTEWAKMAQISWKNKNNGGRGLRAVINTCHKSISSKYL